MQHCCPDQKGGNFITTLIKARLSGKTVNYDGKTDITAEERGNYSMGRIVVGRAQGWTEKDFVSDISGDDYSAAAGEVAEFWDDVDQDTLLSILKGVFSMSTGEGKKFVDAHTYDIAGATENTFGPTTLNNAMQKALGDKKANFSLAIMHSVVATNLENLKLLEYMKYTDADGIERDLGLATLNGRVVLIDDTMPVEEVAESSDDAGDGYTKYTTYVLGNGAIEYTNCGVKVPSEMDRNPARNGGEDTLYTRQRKYLPHMVSPGRIPAWYRRPMHSWKLVQTGKLRRTILQLSQITSRQRQLTLHRSLPGDKKGGFRDGIYHI